MLAICSPSGIRLQHTAVSSKPRERSIATACMRGTRCAVPSIAIASSRDTQRMKHFEARHTFLGTLEHRNQTIELHMPAAAETQMQRSERVPRWPGPREQELRVAAWASLHATARCARRSHRQDDCGQGQQQSDREQVSSRTIAAERNIASCCTRERCVLRAACCCLV